MQVRRRLAGIYVIRGKYVEPQGNIQGKKSGVQSPHIHVAVRELTHCALRYIIRLPHYILPIDVSSSQPC